ncbi:hypothetical protein BKA81DRAFT_381688 [Phyllosticta paracitricarpa]
MARDILNVPAAATAAAPSPSFKTTCSFLRSLQCDVFLPPQRPKKLKYENHGGEVKSVGAECKDELKPMMPSSVKLEVESVERSGSVVKTWDRRDSFCKMSWAQNGEQRSESFFLALAVLRNLSASFAASRSKSMVMVHMFAKRSPASMLRRGSSAIEYQFQSRTS